MQTAPLGSAALAAGLSLLLAAPAARADTIRVPADQPDLKAAITAAVDGDVVLVADGVYGGSGNHSVPLLGKAITVRSESGPAACILDGQDKARLFRVEQGEGPDTVIEGFTLRDGKVGDADTLTMGHGLRILGASPTIRNCVIDGCGAKYSGPAFGGRGGGVYVAGGRPLIEDCTFVDDEAEFGGAVYVTSARPVFRRCVFRGNRGVASIDPPLGQSYLEGDGGAMYLQDARGSLIEDCVFDGNASIVNGGALHIVGGGAGVRPGLVSRCTFFGNGTLDPVVSGPGQVIHAEGQTVPWRLEHCIVAGSTPDLAPLDDTTGNGLLVSFSDVQQGYPGTGNIDADPLFVDPGAGDFRLAAGSPCVDAGQPGRVPDQPQDIARGSRLLDGDLDGALTLDLGAYESSHVALSVAGTPAPGATIDLTLDGTAGLDGVVLAGLVLDPTPPLTPFGFKLVDAPLLPPLFAGPAGLPDTVQATLPDLPAGTSLYLLPLAFDRPTGTGTFGSWVALVLQ